MTKIKEFFNDEISVMFLSIIILGIIDIIILLNLYNLNKELNDLYYNGITITFTDLEKL